MMGQIQTQAQELLRVAEQAVRLMTVWDLADIAIVAYATYRLLLFIRKSRSGQVAKAIVMILVGALVISSFNHLKVINFNLSSAMEMGLIALAIVFQPELRRLLFRGSDAPYAPAPAMGTSRRCC